jgi:hypothetical protein
MKDAWTSASTAVLAIALKDCNVRSGQQYGQKGSVLALAPD